jgi:hypothetical protein
MNNNGRGLVAVASALAVTMMLGAGSAQASHVDCSTELGNLSNAINAALYRNPNKDRDRMDDKVTQVGLKIDAHKFSNAEDKLKSINSKVKALRDADKPKIFDNPATIGVDEVEDILDKVDDALLCVPGGDTSAPH